MGEMADMYDGYDDYNDDGDLNPWEGGFCRCDRCGLVGDWGQDESGAWKIFNRQTGKPHDCNKEQAENIFEDLTT